MPLQINDNLDPSNLPQGSNIIQSLNILATQIKQLSGKSTWRTKPDYSIATAVKGDKGDTGAQGIQGIKGDKGDAGEPAPLNHQHQIADVLGLQVALDNKISPHPGFLSGRYYASSFYFSIATLNLAPGNVYYTYFFIPFNQAFTSIAFYVSSAGSSTQVVRLSIYAIKDGLPFSLIRDFGEISVNTNGIKELSNSFFLPAGWYAIAMSSNAATAAFYYPSMALTNLIGNTTLLNTINGYRVSAAYAPAANTAPVAGINAAISPLIWLKTA